MSEVLYEAHPLIFRMRPAATLIVAAIMFVGLLFVGVGRVGGASLESYQYIGIAMFAAGTVRLYTWYAPTRFERLLITNEGVLWTRGFMTRQRVEIRMENIRDVQLEQGDWQRRLYVGDVSIYTDGKRPALVVRGMPYPERIQAALTGRATA